MILEKPINGLETDRVLEIWCISCTYMYVSKMYWKQCVIGAIASSVISLLRVIPVLYLYLKVPFWMTLFYDTGKSLSHTYERHLCPLCTIFSL